jgi:hypothetical protein
MVDDSHMQYQPVYSQPFILASCAAEYKWVENDGRLSSYLVSGPIGRKYSRRLLAVVVPILESYNKTPHSL